MPRRRRADIRRSTPAGRGPGSVTRSATRTSIEQPSRSCAGHPKSCSAPASTRSMRPRGRPRSRHPEPARALVPSRRRPAPPSPCRSWRPGPPSGGHGSVASHAPPTRQGHRTVGAHGCEGVRCGPGCRSATSGTTRPAPQGRTRWHRRNLPRSRAHRRRQQFDLRLAGAARGGPRRPRVRRAERPDRPAERAGGRAVRLRPRRSCWVPRSSCCCRRPCAPATCATGPTSTRHPRVRSMGSRLALVARHRDGSEIPVEVSLVPWLAGEPGWVIAAIRDVTEQRALEAASARERGAPAPDRRERRPRLHPAAAAPARLPVREPQGPAPDRRRQPGRDRRGPWPT